MRKLYRRATAVLQCRRGEMFPLTVAMVLILLMMILAAAEYFKMMILVSGVKDAYEQAIISVVNDNYNEVYHCVREGYGGGYQPTGAGFYQATDLGEVDGRMMALLGLQNTGTAYAKVNASGTMEYQISNLQVSIHNTQICVGGESFYALGTLKMQIPVRFGNRLIVNLPINLKVKSVLREKF